MSAHRESLFFLAAALILILHLGTPAGSHADWPSNGIPACQAPGEQVSPQLVADQDGGVIVAWEDRRAQDSDIYAQRIDANGQLLWTTIGVAVCNAFMPQRSPVLVSDGANGAIIIWEDYRIGNAEIYAQRVGASGDPLWARNGVPVCPSLPAGYSPVAVPDAAGGAIIAWEDISFVLGTDIYAQRIDGSGVPLWQVDRVSVCAAPRSQLWPRMISDGAGGALLVWEDHRLETGSVDLYAQRIDASGAALWARDGVLVSTAEGSKTSARVAPDGARGVFVTWQTHVPTGIRQVQVQRVDALGHRLWSDEGRAVYTYWSFQEEPDITADGSGGAVVAWAEVRSGSTWDLYAQRYDASGASFWPAEGVGLCMVAGYQRLPRLVADTNGGVIAIWSDWRSPRKNAIYAQKLSAAGEPRWAPGGVGVCTSPANASEHTIVSTQTGAHIVAWDDSRDNEADIYAQRLESVTPIVVQEFNIVQTATSLRLSWKLASDAERDLDAIGIQRAPSAHGPWSRLATLRCGDPIEFEDFGVRHAETYWYSLVLVAMNGTQHATSPIRVEFRGVASQTALFAPYVSPAGTVELSYSLAAQSPIRLELFDVSGRRIHVLDRGIQGPGEHHVTWDRLNASGIRVPAGIYVLRLMSGSEVYGRKLPLVR